MQTSMRILSNVKSKIFALILGALLWVTSGYALEISDLALPMNRDKADDTLSKDYMYKVLGDGSIRRTWQLSDKKVFMDFAADNGDLLLIAIEYNKPVSLKVGLKDAKTIAGEKLDKEAKWAAPKSEEARKMVQETYGLENPKRMKLKDDAVLFYELDRAKKKVTRVSLFAMMPSTNRWVLATLTPESRRSAFGLQITADEIANLYKDEQRRMATPLASNTTKSTDGEKEKDTTDDAASSTVSSTSNGDSSTASSSIASADTPSPRKYDRRVTAMGVVAGASSSYGDSSSSNVSSGRTGTMIVREASEGFSVEEFLGEPPDWLKAVGIEKPEWWHYFAAGIGIFLVLSIILSNMAASARRARQRAAFEKIMASHATPGKKRPRINR